MVALLLTFKTKWAGNLKPQSVQELFTSDNRLTYIKQPDYSHHIIGLPIGGNRLQIDGNPITDLW